MKLKLAAAIAGGLTLAALCFIQYSRIESDVDTLRVQAARGDVAALDAAAQSRREADARVRELASEIERLRDEQRNAGERLEATTQTATLKLGAARQEIEARTQTVEERLAGLESGARENRVNAESAREVLQNLKRALTPDVDRLYRWIMNPSVQVTARDAVGGGTILRSIRDGDRAFDVYVLTAYHVIQKSIPKPGETTDPIEVKLYKADGAPDVTTVADVVAFTDRRDIAVLKVTIDHDVDALAHLAARDCVRGLRAFAPVYAVGCPLGHDPMPTAGEISSTHKLVNGENFWMINAPTIFGNSGGGIFHRETHELIGLSAMICTYDNFVSTPVPHMSIMVSMDAVYDWLNEQNLQFVYDSSATREACLKRREQAEKQPKAGS